ncbi:MAG: hypothetical protein KKF30_19235 [Proteobacteria bacterium]|nr:hypothetical protein [Pseudomonadota bacterium]
MSSTEEKIKNLIFERDGKIHRQQIARELKSSLGYIDILCRELERKGEITVSGGWCTLKQKRKENSAKNNNVKRKPEMLIKKPEKKIKEIKKKLKPIKPFIKETKEEKLWLKKFVNQIKICITNNKKRRENMQNKLKNKTNKTAVDFLMGLAEGMIKGIGGLLGFAAEMERQGKSEHIEQGEIKGKTKNGKEYRGAYGLRVKVGLNPEEFRGQKRLSKGGQHK